MKLPSPHDTWRQLAVISASLGQGATIWHHVDWVLSDPNIVDANEILPCHTSLGSWNPGTVCDNHEFVETPEVASGNWDRGAIACGSTAISTGSSTCAGMLVAPETPVAEAPLSVPGAEEPPKAPTRVGGCQVGPTQRRSGASLIALGCLLIFVRRRAAVALAATVASGAGCTSEDDPQVDSGSSGTGPPPVCTPQMPSVPGAGNDMFKGLISGRGLRPDYTRVAVGHVDSNAGSQTCCVDYALGAPDENEVAIAFGAQSAGLIFLADQPLELVDIDISGQEGVDDLELADIDNDGATDLIALRTDGSVTVSLGLSPPPMGGPYFGTTMAYSTAGLGGVAHSDLAVADVNCDGELDVVSPASTSDQVIVLESSGGSLGSPSLEGVGTGVDPLHVRLADVDGDGSVDIVIAGGDGDISIVLNDCTTGFEPPEVIEFSSGSTPDVRLAVGQLCPDHPATPDIAVSSGEFVNVMCVDSAGSAENVAENHGVSFGETDYRWEFDSAIDVEDIEIWGADRELYALTDNPNLVQFLHPNNCGAVSLAFSIGSIVGSGLYSDLVVHHEDGMAGSWTRGAFVGDAGLGVIR